MAIHTVYTLFKDDPEARSWLGFFRSQGCTALNNLVIERVFWLEGNVKVERLLPLLVNPLYQVPAEQSQLNRAQFPCIGENRFFPYFSLPKFAISSCVPGEIMKSTK